VSRGRTLLVALSAVAALALPTNAWAQNRQLTAIVGPDFTITLNDASGARVTNLDPGTYDIVVRDRSDLHNFHLFGPGVEQSTTVEFVGELHWTVTLTAGRYTYICDPHATAMRGAFTVGPQGTPPTQTPPPTRLNATVGPGFTITLRTQAGARVRNLRAGRYVIVVRDRSRAHNFHLTGPGLNRRTTVGFVGTVTWRLTLRAGRYSFVCDPHARGMRGAFRVT